MIREGLGVRVVARDGQVRVSGERKAVLAARLVMDRLVEAAERNAPLGRHQVLELIGRSVEMAGDREQAAELFHGAMGAGGAGSWATSTIEGPPWADHLDVYAGGEAVRARTANQQVYLDAIRDHDVVFGIGPAGTGKTYLAVAAAVHLLKHGRIRKVILARPAVEAGEKLGFLPGDLQAKVNPYLRPLFDALNDMMDFNTMKRFMVSDVVEVVPLAYMRGRTLNRACIILDEAQNTTRGQMKMFLTRMGHGSKVIVTGDATQIDLPDPSASGLVDAARVLKKVPGVAMISLTEEDIVRNPMVARIVEAYGRMEAAGGGSAGGRGGRRGRGAAGGAGGAESAGENGAGANGTEDHGG
ncbi:MAG: PhoH family protein [Planctomycetaceae bacterium]|jgi:phosphate starvation-inducible PhoH-like protein|nr:PhoH family protein [Planctomycetaceae bacterium]